MPTTCQERSFLNNGSITVHEPGTRTNDLLDDGTTDYILGAPPWKPYWAEPKLESKELDTKFLEKQYGFRTDGYLPLDRMGKVKEKVGVQIATNVDLSQWTAAELRELGVREGIVRKVAPYCQLRGQFALNKMTLRPLTLRKEESMELRNACTSFLAHKIRNSYNDSIQGKPNLKPWEKLHKIERTVIYDVLTQCEVKTINRGPNDVPYFWSMAVDQNWKSAVEVLKYEDASVVSRSRPQSRRASVRLLKSRESSRERPTSSKHQKKRVVQSAIARISTNEVTAPPRRQSRDLQNASPAPTGSGRCTPTRVVGHPTQPPRDNERELGSSSVSLTSPTPDSRRSSSVATPVPSLPPATRDRPSTARYANSH